MFLDRHIVGEGHCLPFDHAVDAGPFIATVKFEKAFGDVRIGLGAAPVVADILDPCRDMVGFRPSAGMPELPKQRPLAGAVATAAAAPP